MKLFSRLFLSGAMTFVLSNVSYATNLEEINNESRAVQQVNNNLPLDQADIELPSEIIAYIASLSRISEGYSIEHVSKAWKKSLTQYNVWEKYAERIQGYSRVKEEYQKEHPGAPINYKAILRELMKPKVFLDVHVIPDYKDVFIKAISMDGKVFCLEARNLEGDIRGFRWTSESGYQPVNSIINNKTFEHIMDANGNSIGGTFKNGQEPGFKAFLWTAENGIQLLGTLNGGPVSVVKAVSADGKIIAGDAHDGQDGNKKKAFIWTAENGIQPLGTLNGGGKSTVSAISFNGRVIVGNAEDGQDGNKEKAFIWTDESGIKPLLNDTISGNSNPYAHSKATCVSEDGSAIAGYTKDFKAFRWTAENGTQLLDMPEGMTSSYCQAMSSDGKNIVVKTANPEEKSFFIWSSTTGMLSIPSILKGFPGVKKDLGPEIILSGDGTLIASKSLSGWYAYIPRYDTFIQEGINLLPTKLKSNMEE